jgi:hypothetical protein
MPLDDPMLRIAYAQIFLRTGDGKTQVWETATRKDLLRRGNTATPLLLSLFEEDPEGYFRGSLMSQIEIFSEAIDLKPFLAAARSLFQREGLKLPPRTCYGMAWLLERHGTAADRRILEQMRNHPVREVGFVIKPNIDRMTKRLAQGVEIDQATVRLPAATPVATTPAPTTPVPSATPAPATPVAQTPAPAVEHQSAVWPWLVGILALIAIVAVALKWRA